jgi:hypothetical protein
MGANTHAAVDGHARVFQPPMERLADHSQRPNDPNGQISRTRALVTAAATILLPILLLAVAAVVAGR